MGATFAVAAGGGAMSVLPALLRPHSSALSCSASSRFPPAAAAAAAVSFAVERLSTGNFSAAATGEPYFLHSRSLSSAKQSQALPASAFACIEPLRTRFSSQPRALPLPGLKGRAVRVFAAMSSEVKESAANNPGLDEKPDDATKGFFLQQTMYRIKDPKVSLDFYTRILGMSLLKRLDFSEAKFSLYFLGYEDVGDAPTDEPERVKWTFSKKATLELTHNWGTETDADFKGHHNGNTEPRGYGHIGITVDDTNTACDRFEKLGVKFVKKPDAGRMKGIAFIQDPDGYWIEIFDIKSMGKISAS